MFSEALVSWNNFYFMIGGAAAGLLGLMFVALSLGMNLVPKQESENFNAFVTPSVVYFVSVILIASGMLVPVFTPSSLGILHLIGGVLGIIQIQRPVRHLIRTAAQQRDFNAWDWMGQIILPVAGYSTIVISGITLLIDQWSIGLVVMWIATMMLLLAAIANTWGLVLWIIAQRTDE